MSILGVGASALNLAQIGLTTTGHNIANAATPGYTRQLVVSASAGGQDTGFGFVGRGVEVGSVSRVYSQFLTDQVRTAQTSESQFSTYKAQISQLDNLVADPAAGISPVLQEFFSGVQGVANDANSAASRQVLLSSGNSLVSRFQSISQQMEDKRVDVNGQIAGAVTDINLQATTIANLNDQIARVQGGSGKPANDLLDMRDQAVSELSKQIKVSVVQQGSDYNVYMGDGQALVVGTKVAPLLAVPSKTDPGRTEVGYRTSTGSNTIINESALAGGVLGGLLQYRATTLDPATNELGRVAISLGTQFNAQHALGITQTGAAGGNFFTVPGPAVQASSSNTGTAQASATIVDATQLTTSDYRVKYLDSTPPSYSITRLSDGKTTTFDAADGKTATVDGVTFGVAGTAKSGDEFLVQPTVNGARAIGMAITNTLDIAAAAAVATSSAGSANGGTASISAPMINSTTLLNSPVTLTYSPGTGTLSGFPAGMPVTVTNAAGSITYAAGQPVPYDSNETVTFGGISASIDDVNAPPSPKFPVSAPLPVTLTYSASQKTFSGVPKPLVVTVTTDKGSTVYAPGVPIPYSVGSTISFGGISTTITGSPNDGDSFTLGKNTTGVGDNRNALLLGKLQTANTIDGTTNFQGAYSKMVSAIGSKAHEIDVLGTAASAQLEQSNANQQSLSGVNLDEEAATLLRYQQAYQAAGKLIQTGKTLFETLLSLGG